MNKNRMRPEQTIEQWIEKFPKTWRREAKFERGCGGSCEHVFRCRAPRREGFSCGRWFCACYGDCDSNRCVDCWYRREKAKERAAKTEAA